MDARKRIVQRGYDATAEAFSAARRAGPERRWVERLIAGLAPGAAVLELGCGNGAPVAATLVDSGFAVTGVDFSEEQVRRARARLPVARFVVADMAEVELPPRAFDAVVAWDSIFHVPPEEQPALFRRIAGWVVTGAPVLITLGGSAGDLHTEHLGAPMYYGALAAEEAERALREAGFEIVESVIDDPGGHGHRVLLLRADG